MLPSMVFYRNSFNKNIISISFNKCNKLFGCKIFENKMSTSAVRVPSKEKASASLIFLHGLGDTGHGWAEGFKDLELKNVQCVFPNAPIGPVTFDGERYLIPTWGTGRFDPSRFDENQAVNREPEDDTGIIAASKNLAQLINEEISENIPAERILIGGFSQGGAVALHTAFATNVKIGGVIALSTWLPLTAQFKDQTFVKYNTNVPVFVGHGTSDNVLPYSCGESSYKIIKTFNSSAIFKSYRHMAHSSSAQEMMDVKQFVEKVVGSPLSSHL